MLLLQPPKLIYVSGPMTGFEDFNRASFNEARGYLQAAGFSVIIPGDDEEYTTEERAVWKVHRAQMESYMFRDFLHILASGAVAVLDDWELSVGSRVEVIVAQEIGIPVVDWFTLEPIEEKVVTHVEHS